MNQKQENLITVLDAGSYEELRAGGGAAGWRAALSRAWHRTIARDAQGLDCGTGAGGGGDQPGCADGGASGEGGIETAVVGIGGTHVRGVNSRGGISMGSRMREITREEVRAAVDRARAVALPPDREVLHLLPQEFILDDQPGIHDPIGMVGNKLEVNLHLSTCSGGVAQSVMTCANRAGLEVRIRCLKALRRRRRCCLRMSASWASASRISVRARRSWWYFSRGRWRTRRYCRLAEITSRTTLRWGCM